MTTMNTTLKAIMICVICAATLMSGCVENETPHNVNVGVNPTTVPTVNPTIEPTVTPTIESTIIPTIELYYDSNSIKTYTSMGNGVFPTPSSDGGNTNGFGMLFTPPNDKSFTINSIKFSGHRYGSDCNMRVEIWDINKNVLYSRIMKHSDVFTTTDSWGIINIPDITINNDFYIVVFTDSTNPNKNPTTGVYINIDISTSPEKRMYVVTDKNMVPDNGIPENAVWMIRVSGESSDKVETPPSAPITAPMRPKVPTELNLKIGHTASTSEVEITVISVYKKYYYDYLGYSGLRSKEANNGNTFIIANVNMKNVGKERAYLGSLDLSVTDSNGYRYDRSYYHGDDGLESIQELYQNQQMTGIIIFEVPKNAIDLKIQYDFGNIFGSTKIASWSLEP